MASSQDYLEYLMEQLSQVEGISYRPMMGEYIIYHHGKVIGGLYDNRFLVKPTQSAQNMMPEADWELPYDGAKKKMLLVDDLDNKQFLCELLNAIYEELPVPKKR